MTSTFYHAKHGETFIQCERTTSRDTGKQYPVLTIGEVTIFPTDAQLEQIHAAIGSYLDAHVHELQESI